jgi:glycosyltransferase involved in cell wall biosynthesis
MFNIIIPTHDRPLLLRRTLESLIAQTCQDFKVIIVSDTPGYVPPYKELNQLPQRFNYVLRGTGVPGPADSRDLGVAMADAEYVLFLDDDDTYRPDHIAKLKARLANDKPELLFYDFQVHHEDRTVFPPVPLPGDQRLSISHVTADSLYVRPSIPNCCIAYRRDVLQGVRHDASLIIYEDWDFLLSALRGGRRMVHYATDGVVIHKSAATAPENMRRGNSREDRILEIMLQLYRKHPAPNMALRLARQGLMASAGVALDLGYF